MLYFTMLQESVMLSQGGVLVWILPTLLAVFPIKFLLSGMSSEISAEAYAPQSGLSLIIHVSNDSDVETESHQWISYTNVNIPS